jgi:hypothetical protein
MKRKTKNMLRAIAKHFGFKIVFVSYFSAGLHGKLLPREKRILINAHQPRCEHIFTLLHEVGHYIQHVLNPHRRHHPRVFEHPWKSRFLAEVSSHVRRYFRFIFNRTRGKEWETDLWAMCAFIYLVKAVGCRAEFDAFLKRHPEKRNVFLLAVGGTIYSGIKSRIENICQCLLLPFSATFR